ncbi:MAG: hypothetical protein U1E27_04500, partial [Kiritimatiellia bacterium]|nr:hypothetical protein [Kiritimatiellia bacterium]
KTQNGRRIGGWTAAIWMIGILAAWGQFQKGQTVAGVRYPDYDEDGKLKSLLLGEGARMISDTRIEISGLQLKLYRNGEEETQVTSPYCLYDHRNGSVSSTSSVRIARANLEITGEHFSWNTGSQRFLIEKNARVVVQGTVKATPSSLGKKP